MEVSISGGEEVTLQPQTFNALMAFHLIRIDGTRRFIIRRSSFLDLTSASLLMQVQSCDRFVVETNAFKNMQVCIKNLVVLTILFVFLSDFLFGQRALFRQLYCMFSN